MAKAGVVRSQVRREDGSSPRLRHRTFFSTRRTQRAPSTNRLECLNAISLPASCPARDAAPSSPSDRPALRPLPARRPALFDQPRRKCACTSTRVHLRTRTPLLLGPSRPRRAFSPSPGCSEGAWSSSAQPRPASSPATSVPTCSRTIPPSSRALAGEAPPVRSAMVLPTAAFGRADAQRPVGPRAGTSPLITEVLHVRRQLSTKATAPASASVALGSKSYSGRRTQDAAAQRALALGARCGQRTDGSDQEAPPQTHDAPPRVRSSSPSSSQPIHDNLRAPSYFR